MPVNLISSSFVDPFGVGQISYTANVGDEMEGHFVFSSNISMSSGNGVMTLDPNTKIVTSSNNFEEEGFRVGDTLLVIVTTSTGGGVATYADSVVDVNGNTIKLQNATSWADPLNQELVIIYVNRSREDVNCFINHIPNGTTTGDFSLIDGETTRFYFENIQTLGVGSVLNATIVGNQSGQYLKWAKIERLTSSGGELRYKIKVRFFTSGLYDNSSFVSSDCLKFFIKTLWASKHGEHFMEFECNSSYDANTGWFDEGFNFNTINSSITTGITSLDYSQSTPFTIVVTGATSPLGIGASYIPQDDTYYKNKPLQQGNYGYIIPTTPLAVGSLTSMALNGASYDLQITAVTTVGLTTTITGNFIPNAQFSSFMSARDEGDRTFYVWVRCGNVNLLVHNGQLIKAPAPSIPLTMVHEYAFNDHSQNYYAGVWTNLTTRFDTEDDCAFKGIFRVAKNAELESFTARIIARNDSTDEQFTLQEHVLNLSNVQVDANGITLVNESLTINPQLPTTSEKRNLRLQRAPSDDISFLYGVMIYFPFILRWEYWLHQLNANVFFYPNQTMDWEVYSENSGWEVQVELELATVNNRMVYRKIIYDKPYNNDALILSSIEYIRESDGAVVTSLLDNEIMRIKATHESLYGGWSPDTWGMITIEPWENSGRWISSTAIDYDGNVQNPLYPITGNRATLTLSGNIATVECLLDTSKLSGTDYKLTAKIKDLGEPKPIRFKTISPDDSANKTTSADDQYKTLAE